MSLSRFSPCINPNDCSKPLMSSPAALGPYTQTLGPPQPQTHHNPFLTLPHHHTLDAGETIKLIQN